METSLVQNKAFNFTPSSLAEAMEYAKLIANSELVPKDYRGKPQNVMIAVQMGAELGLSPILSLQKISIINGKATLAAEALLALIRTHPQYESDEGYFEGEGDNRTAVFKVKRKGSDWHESRFSIKDAKKAGLWGKAGAWTTYSDQMQMHRAVSFGCRFKFADALMGLISEEEAQDYPKEDSNYVDITPVQEVQSNGKASEYVSSEIVDVEEIEEEKTQSSLTNALLFQALQLLLEQHPELQESVPKWEEKFNISSLTEASSEILEKIISGVKKKYGK
jgi:hypothetical protein